MDQVWFVLAIALLLAVAVAVALRDAPSLL